MADIFLSYNEKDRDTVRRLAETLASVGWSVWWDRRIPAGGTWRELLERELQAMRCMVVVWSSNSVRSEWVCEEATEGREAHLLVPVSIERVKPPAGFREIQAADLVGWDGTATFLGMKTLIEDIQQKIGTPSIVAPSPPIDAAPRPVAAPRTAPPRRMPPAAWIGGTALLVTIGVTSTSRWWWPSRNEDTSVTSTTTTPAPTPPPGTATAPAPAAITAQPADSPTSSATNDSPGDRARAPANERIPEYSPPSGRPSSTAAHTSSTAAARCADLLQKVSLGETLSQVSKDFMRKECSK